MDFKNKLKFFRTKKGLTQKELADKANISQSAIAEYEKGTKTPTFPVVCELADKLEINVDELR